MTRHVLHPIEGAWVRRLDPADPRIGRVLGTETGEAGTKVRVEFGPGSEFVIDLAELRCGLQPDHIVQDVPLSATRKTMGLCRVIGTRTLAGQEQALVQVEATGETLWLPYESLRRMQHAGLRFQRAIMANPDGGERFALATMAHALKSWNEATGALDRLDVDPLPHQIQLVHRILASGQTNWIIADDVGLGKTIEFGLLIGGLERRRQAKRVLIVAPSGLTLNWQREMKRKFNRDFEIYGRDFNVHEAWQWARHDFVIAPLDTIKPNDAMDFGKDMTTNFGRILASGDWDVIAFDEGHRLSRAEDGDQTLRHRLAKALRSKTDGYVVLTGTPHPGDTGRFRSLLKLVRPDLADQIDMLDINPEIVSEVVLRNRKIDVTTAEGEFVFKGQKVNLRQVPSSEEARALNDALQEYLAHGYRLAEKQGGSAGMAIGFVMTAYRKLASSSAFALAEAMRRRLEKIRSPNAELEESEIDQDFSAIIAGEAEEHEVAVARDFEGPATFFNHEGQYVEKVIARCEDVIANDLKMRDLELIVDEIVTNGGKKMIIFTEYLSTQRYLHDALTKYLKAEIPVINGGMNVDQREEALRIFETEAPILISTEAGGEGANMHNACHILMNYDLPWNPSRLMQRIGRVYRYGQTQPVLVLNMITKDTVDTDIIGRSLMKVTTIAQEMATVSSEYDERYVGEIIGDLLEHLDLTEILEQARSDAATRSQQRIDEALARARHAKEVQDEILTHAEKFDPEALIRLGSYTTTHLENFLRRTMRILGIAVTETRREGVFSIRLRDEDRGRFPEFGNRLNVDVTTDRKIYSPTGDVELLDFRSSFVRFLIEVATSADFEGTYGWLPEDRLAAPVAGVFTARWQNDQGRVTGEEMVVVGVAQDGKATIDNRIIAPLFGKPIEAVPQIEVQSKKRTEALAAARTAAEALMASQVSRFKHPNDLVLLGVGETPAA